jgi:putative PIN family toxin of toxin-antitoxin system
MKVVVDTNVVISGTFFGGNPRRVVEAVVDHRVGASASASILEEYDEVVEEVIRKGYGHFDAGGFRRFVDSLSLVSPTSEIRACRDPDDDKFIECAVDAKALYIVSGDKDLLDLGSFAGVEIVTAAEFCERYL